MIAQVRTKRYIACPRDGCGGMFWVEHLLEKAARVRDSFGPWYCSEDHCDVVMNVRVTDYGSLDVEFAKRNEKRGLALLTLGNALLVYKEHALHDPEVSDNYDYFFHSHQCPINLVRGTIEVFIDGQRDKHGQIRYVASAEDTPEFRDRLKGVNNLDELLALFGTDGSLPPTVWPPENEGLLSWLVELRSTTQRGN